jgi:hypothetical protein
LPQMWQTRSRFAYDMLKIGLTPSAKFGTKQEAKRWIDDHRWLTERPVERSPASSAPKP